MDIIELGEREAQEVFRELKYRLKSMGYLPDEYFLMDSEWENGRTIPKGANIFCTTDYGASEGVYLDVYLKWYENQQPVTKSFITGKTLGENGNDMDRMFLISSAITKAFHGDNATHTRFQKINGVEDDTGGSVVHLSQQEQLSLIHISAAAVRIPDSGRHILEPVGYPTELRPDGGQLPLVKIHIVHICDPAALLHAGGCHPVKRIRRNLLSVMEHIPKRTRPQLLPQTGPDISGSRQHPKGILHPEVFRHPMLRYPESGELPAGLRLLFPPLILRQNLTADLLPYLFRQLVNQLVQMLVQFVLHRFLFQLSGQRLIPPLIHPEDNLSIVHRLPPLFSEQTGWA